METDHKLIEDVKRLLHAAGFKQLLVNTSSQGTSVSGQKGNAGAVFYVTPHISSKASLRQTAAGGREPHDGPVEVVMAPGIQELDLQLTKEPVETAKLLRIAPEVLQYLVTLPPAS